MEQRTYHGNLNPQNLADALLATFNQGDLRALQRGRGKNIIVQIGSAQMRRSGGSTAISVHLTHVEDGVHIQLGEQQWLGVAASLGKTALMALIRPATLIGRLDDVAQDISSLGLADRIMETIQRRAEAMGASHEISQRLRRLICPYCSTANPVGDPHCLACGGPLGFDQPVACNNCGYVSEGGTTICPECATPFPD
jgi:hypothetical protein